ncbi:MAG: ATP-binding protein [Lachnospiraceae bacterium]|uniref:ATP-binding protein n=1 Tax=Roseburia hominis TaxID=301301 RepID=UPI001F16227D|nr:GHKL domain-containing protein [Roseburia hominis]MCI5713913.1 ATP-binding protein [Lachnospiraceae bacterium]MDD6170639.1 ATP-binding protein [Lachnospiraceae bacterium]MDY4839060.1 ATP-binding protein [Lachnospiraceae bacterium]
MKKKINMQFLIMSLTAILLTLGISVAVSYNVLKKEIMQNLKTCTHILMGTGVFDDMEHMEYNASKDNLRITLIGEDGKVEYDSDVDIAGMENHENRPEIEQAVKDGEGESIRTSETVGQSMFYYAVRLSDGRVFRVAKETGNLFSILAPSFPIAIVLAMFLAVLGAVLAHYLTKSIVTPIEQMANDMDHLESICTYKELKPFITTIQEQHDDIKKNADMRQEFTANVSHELKTPLTSISGYSELIENGMANDEDVVRFAGEIHQSANRLLTLINDIIRLSELDVSTEVILYENLDLYEMAVKCVSMLEMNAGKHDVTLKLVGKSTHLNANKEMMNELLYNLCDNAIRYNKKGGSVTVSVGETNDNVILSVEDTGIGIPDEHKNRVFERFYRVDKSRSKQTGGTGLGLAIVKHIVAQHHAKLELNSEIGVGTKISVLFPKKKEG